MRAGGAVKTILHLVNVAATRETVFKALTSTDGLAAWWTTKVSGDAGVGGLIDFTFAGDFNPDMRVAEIEPPSLVSWRCVGGVEQWADNGFRFELMARNGATTLRFRQDYAAELSDDDYATYNYNWGYYIDSLRLYCETGTGKPYGANV
jgi:uncharacterized protein YndB with AHSA1/START domain